MALKDGMEDRLWNRFVRKDGPTRIDRLTLSQPLVVGAGMILVVAVGYVMLGRLIFGTETDGAAIVESLMYATIFTSVFLVLQRRALRRVIERWDAGADRGDP